MLQADCFTMPRESFYCRLNVCLLQRPTWWWTRLPAAAHQPCPLPQRCASWMRDTPNRLLAYRWYPTSFVNWDGRLLNVGGVDLDQNTGCEHILFCLV